MTNYNGKARNASRRLVRLADVLYITRYPAAMIATIFTIAAYYSLNNVTAVVLAAVVVVWCLAMLWALRQVWRRDPYEGSTIEVNGRRRVITGYDPTTRVATVAEPFDEPPGAGSAFTLWLNGEE